MNTRIVFGFTAFVPLSSGVCAQNAGPHTVDMAINEAWTAVSFNTSTLELAKDT